jgi:hypothetical protein
MLSGLGTIARKVIECYTAVVQVFVSLPICNVTRYHRMSRDFFVSSRTAMIAIVEAEAPE